MKKIYLIEIFIFLTCYFLISSTVCAETPKLTIQYKLNFNGSDKPIVEISAKNLINRSFTFNFALSANALGSVGDLKRVFTDYSVTGANGEPLSFEWTSDHTITVGNVAGNELLMRYTVNSDFLGTQDGGPVTTKANKYFSLFQKNNIFFIAGDIFMLPAEMPESISLEVQAPTGLSVISSMFYENGKFVEKTNLWNNLLLDFQKEYFMAAKTVFTEDYITKWGDTYTFVWREDNPFLSSMFENFGDTDKKIVNSNFTLLEDISEIFRNMIGPLPNRRILLANNYHQPEFPVIMTNTDWYHYIQIWPESDVTSQFIHHVFHQYSFFPSQSKLSFNHQSFLGEGLPTYLECTLSKELQNYGVDLTGKLYEFVVFETRGKLFNIGENTVHRTYNRSAMKVFEIDRMIRESTDNKKDVRSFITELWALSKDNEAPKSISSEQIDLALEKTVGKSMKGYIQELEDKESFDELDYASLLPAFNKYFAEITSKYFNDNKFLTAVFMDIIVAKGEEWPHYAMYGDNITRYCRDEITALRRALLATKKEIFNENDIIKALSEVTGKNHEGFFEYWASIGYTFKLEDIRIDNTWGIDAKSVIRIPNNVLNAIENQKREEQKAREAFASNEVTASNAPDTGVDRLNNTGNKQWIYYIGAITLIIIAGFIISKIKMRARV